MGLYRRGQSLLEYSILFAVVLSAILIMQFYVKRGYQGRLKKEADTVGQQYAPGHTTSIIVTGTNSISASTVADGINSTVIGANSSMDKKETIDSYATE
jgi:hypothetical protein